MSYLHIKNLYADKTVLMFKEVFCLEKIEGTSANIRWDYKSKTIYFSSGGASSELFLKIFDYEKLKTVFLELFLDSNVILYGEAYGGKIQKMSEIYGKDLKFVGFDVKVNDTWLDVSNAEIIFKKFDLDFVDYVKTTTDLVNLDFERDKESIQAIKNGMGNGKFREGIIIRPLIEFKDVYGERVIAKHKAAVARETNTIREVSDEQFKILEDAKAIAIEYVTENRLRHVLDKLPQGIGMEKTKDVVEAMVEDVYREAKGEIVENKAVTKAISSRTAELFKRKIQNSLRD